MKDIETLEEIFKEDFKSCFNQKSLNFFPGKLSIDKLSLLMKAR